ncbi:PhaM family polyhydroxyalkanoate granule multifunctional regulatory protein [Lautropia mirabilis ATCC 51599]|jgi:hypothetical protein|uniref:Uncharacterized protein n=1 Tax=Lautropia mirabilis ATCC 51599 TaxID=887898 RepID=E7RZ85_9BURK|nr:PhaM family polyhydroxyalkanoate granule multifunctional regulatory protein [Lautropia mirabilis]EFV93884.1 hypothetical protein HMPREF0551_1999 [Lautropia mirabilis ATCC 51599]VEH00239.1 Uncharacterised protein [Lautropia mirabilis]
MTRMKDIPAGAGQSSDPLSSFNIPGNMFNPLESFNQAWRTMQTASSLPPTMSVADLEKRIAELRTVEQWLNLNLGMLRTSIQTLEVQKGTLQALSSLSALMSPDAAQAAMGSSPGHAAAGPDSATGAMDTAQQLSKQWWDVLQAQLAQLSGMTGLQPGAAAPAAADTPKDASAPSEHDARAAASARASTRPRSRPLRRSTGPKPQEP